MGLRKTLRKIWRNIRMKLNNGREDYKSFWIEDNMRNIIPRNRGEFPEGFDVLGLLKTITAQYEFDSIMDFGCGYGRLSQAFDKGKYIGVDLNPKALERAGTENPGYTYQEVFVDSGEFPVVDMCLAYTVFLHLDDATLDSLLNRLAKSTKKYMIIAEIMGREWRRDGLPPVFNREKQEYIDIMSKHGFSCCHEEDRPYARYINDPKFQDKKNKSISFLIFQSCSRTEAML